MMEINYMYFLPEPGLHNNSNLINIQEKVLAND